MDLRSMFIVKQCMQKYNFWMIYDFSTTVHFLGTWKRNRTRYTNLLSVKVRF